ncbi:MAG: acetyl-CoA carboxylase biotin carboxyl carrier protein subunit [Lachnospiraceae bacterium]|jgi:biotin carboxyl carrier protein|nr:acetyl-CoA carboxylase biotin carboxyl carrier protein subunit [Lachnospiraceae bacterium]
MKSYTITVNGNVYDVTVEENGAGGAAAPAPRRAAAPAAAPAAPAAAPAPAPAAGGAGNVRIEAGAAGKVFSIDSKPGDALKRGDTVLVLEVMKMETPVVAPEDGTVASIDVTVGQAVEAGALLATLNN